MNTKSDEEENLCFEVYSKPNFETKYLNMGSCHTHACKHTVPQDISIHVVGLTSPTGNNINTSLSDICPKVDAALRSSAHLKNNGKLPKFGMILDNHKRESLQAHLGKEERSKDRHNTYFVIRYSGQWCKTEHKNIHMLRNKFGLNWLRRGWYTSIIQMSRKCRHSPKSDERRL